MFNSESDSESEKSDEFEELDDLPRFMALVVRILALRISLIFSISLSWAILGDGKYCGNGSFVIRANSTALKQLFIDAVTCLLYGWTSLLYFSMIAEPYVRLNRMILSRRSKISLKMKIISPNIFEPSLNEPFNLGSLMASCLNASALINEARVASLNCLNLSNLLSVITKPVASNLLSSSSSTSSSPPSSPVA
ncbi:hypothetical protein WICPIJ_009148 [Wickerhamomyces pijperi]|uniref:Uncharacterized protein n=1 Tax=Wickerhamomyces pijperi TaxID=599730 RepID=A0A9P8PQC4_WICPI|nr:hypothetical protein WICPIJ_009148 [Wickerhamomyces pijperi]